MGPRCELLTRFSDAYTAGLGTAFFFFVFMATPRADGDSPARGQIGAVAAGLHHSSR